MPFRVRDIDPTGKFLPQLRLDVLAQVYPREAVTAVLAECGAHTLRQRKLNLELALFLVIGMSLFASMPLEAIFDRLAHALRLLWPPEARRRTLLPGKSALCYRRYQLGVRPVRLLFQRFCRPMATQETRGAFLGGLRLMAMDGHTEDLPDTQENQAVFGRPTASRGESAYPQLLAVYLCECGTHAVVDACFLPAETAEDRGAFRLLRSLTTGMLVLLDRGLYSYLLLEALLQRGAHTLCRLPTCVKPQRLQRLADGSFLVRLIPRDWHRRRAGESLQVRLIEYTLTDPQLPGYGQRYRLVTTLLDEEAFPAHTLACTYHERWEIELVFDEQDTHQLGQRQPAAPLRSRKPRGVIQELYGLLLAHYAIRFLMHQAALGVDEDPDRLSFAHALRLIQESVADFELAASELVPQLCLRLLRDLAEPLLPEREPRVEPRVVKCKVIKWPLKRPLHSRTPQPTRPYWKAVSLLNWDGAPVI